MIGLFGHDDSEWQGQGSVERYAAVDFTILRADSGYGVDKDFLHNAPLAAQAGKPWGVYLYLVPNRDIAQQVQRFVATVHNAGLGDPPLGYWIDYEQAGLNPGHLAAAFAELDSFGCKSGYYSNAFDAAFHAPFLGRPHWLAAYPGRNDGTFPGLGAMRGQRPEQLWQFTSTNGTQDVSVVVDENWYSQFVGDVIAPTATPKAGGSMYFGTLVTASGPEAHAIDGDTWVVKMGGAAGAYGIPQDAIDLNKSQGIPFFPINAAILDRAQKRAAGTFPPVAGEPPAPVEVPAHVNPEIITALEAAANAVTQAAEALRAA